MKKSKIILSIIILSSLFLVFGVSVFADSPHYYPEHDYFDRSGPRVEEYNLPRPTAFEFTFSEQTGQSNPAFAEAVAGETFSFDYESRRSIRENFNFVDGNRAISGRLNLTFRDPEISLITGSYSYEIQVHQSEANSFITYMIDEEGDIIASERNVPERFRIHRVEGRITGGLIVQQTEQDYQFTIANLTTEDTKHEVSTYRNGQLISSQERSPSPQRLDFQINEITNTLGGPLDIEIDTEAAESAGENRVPLAAGVIFAGGFMAAAGAAAGVEDKKKKAGSSFKMSIYKDFDNTISIGEKNKFIYARIIEITEAGEEINRPDLTRNIEIFSQDSVLDLEAFKKLRNGYKAARIDTKTDNLEDLIELKADKKNIKLLKNDFKERECKFTIEQNLEECVISFLFRGEGSSFRNNVHFELLAGDFEFKAEYRFDNSSAQNIDYELESREDYALLKLKENKEAEMDEQPYIYTDLKISAISAVKEELSIEKIISVYLWQEGLFLSDYSTHEGKVIINSDKEKDEENRKSRINVFAVSWDEEKAEAVFDQEIIKNLKFTEVQTESRLLENALDKIAMEKEFVNIAGGNRPTANYDFWMNDIIPSKNGEDLKAKFKVYYSENSSTYELDIELLFKTLALNDRSEDWEKEYKNCKHIIEEYLPKEIRKEKLHQLEMCKDRMGVNELVAYRQQVWDIVCEQMEMEKNYWLEVAAWHDKVIYRLEWVEWAGDRATTVVTTALLTSVGAKAAKLSKTAFTSFFGELTSNWDRPIMDTFKVWAYGYAKTLIDFGIEDKVIDMNASKLKSPKMLAVYFVYRLSINWVQEDDNGKSIGVYKAVDLAAQDMADTALDEGIKAMVKYIYG